MSRLIFIFLLFIIGLRVDSTEKIVINPNTDRIGLEKFLFYFEDTTNQLKIEDIQNSEFQTKFQKNEMEMVNFGYSKNSFWLRFDLENLDQENTKEWLLELGYSNIDLVEFYYFDSGVWKKKVYGDLLPFKNREIFNRFFVIPLVVQPEKVYRYYVKIQTTTVLIAPLTIYKTKAFIETSVKQDIWYALFYGAMLMMVLYNGFIYISFKSKSYLLYSLATFFTLLFYIGFNGHGFQYLWSENIWWQNHCVPLFTSSSWICLLSFANRFLELSKNFRRLHIISFFIQALYFLLGILAFFSVAKSVLIQNYIGFCTVIFVFIAGIISLKNGNRAARFFVIAWFTFLVGVVLFTLYIIGIIEGNFLNVHTVQIGSVLELILLSFALADRYQIIQDESKKVQRELLITERSINETLERKVKERTIELNNSLKIIKDDLAMAKKIQSATLNSNLNENEKLEVVVRYIAMTEVGGDFYSVTKMDESSVRIFLADATGHGVQAALIMMAIQAIYDSIKSFALPVNEIMEIFNNEFIRRYGTLNSFLTCILVDIDTTKEKLIYSSAGHPAGLLINKSKKINLLKNTGGLIGVNSNNSYLQVEYPFTKGERFFIFTDGIFEQFIGEEEFGEERLHLILVNSKEKEISSSLDKVLTELEKFLGDTGKQDDMTLIGIGYKKNVQ